MGRVEQPLGGVGGARDEPSLEAVPFAASGR
jgi:hypothetical protein